MSGKCQSSRKSVTSQIRPTVAALQETVDLEALKDYLGTGLDGRTSQLQAYVDRHGSEGVRMGRFSTISVDYYKAPNYGRLLARGPAVQKLTREPRGKAFPHAIEFDAACGHPRLLLRKLRDMGLDEAGIVSKCFVASVRTTSHGGRFWLSISALMSRKQKRNLSASSTVATRVSIFHGSTSLGKKFRQQLI